MCSVGWRGRKEWPLCSLLLGLSGLSGRQLGWGCWGEWRGAVELTSSPVQGNDWHCPRPGGEGQPLGRRLRLFLVGEAWPEVHVEGGIRGKGPLHSVSSRDNRRCFLRCLQTGAAGGQGRLKWPGSLLWVELCSPKRCIEGLTPSTSECGLIWK